jgi:CRISPR-associated protein Csx17
MLGSEVVQFFAEGRALVRRAAASDGWSMARAVASLGVRRGVSEFVRFGYLQRNNLATHFAVPLGRFRVPDRPCSYVACLDDLDGWLRRLRHEARSRNAPDRLKLAERSLTDSLFAVTQEPEHPVRWQAVLIALEGVEGVQITGSGYRAGPAPKLRSEWVEAADDGSVEFRLAVAFALQARKFTTSGRPLDPIRRHWLPLDPKRPRSYATTGTGNQARLQTAVDTVLRGRNGTDDAIALVKRRLIEAAQSGERGLALRPLPGFAVHVADVRSLTCGSVDLNRALTLARALMALDRESPPRRLAPLNSADSAWPDDAWITIRLCTSPWPLPDGRNVPVDPAIFRRLESGDASTAVELALRRLRASGIYPTVRAAAASPETARLWAAALAFPISRQTAMQFVRRLDPHSLKEIA